MSTYSNTRIRNKNTKEQNAATAQNVLAIDDIFRGSSGFPEGVRKFLLEHSISIDNSILVDFGKLPVCCDNTFIGTVLTSRREFWEFEVELCDERPDCFNVVIWRNITSNIEVNAHCKGVGKSFGYICYEILELRFGCG